MAHPTLEQLVAEYVSARTRRGDFGQTTIPCVTWHLRSFCRFAGQIDPESITPVMVDAWLSSTQLARSTLRHRLSWFRGWVRWMIRRGLMSADPTVDLDPIRQPRPAARSLPQGDVARLIFSAGDNLRLRLVILLMAQEGLRACEVARAEVGDIDFEVRSIVVRGKGGVQRLLPVTDQTWATLVRYVDRRSTTGPLVRSRTRASAGLTPAYVALMVGDAMRAAGVAGTGHALRHSMAAHVLRGGRGDVRDVQVALGHANLSTTAVYLPHSDVERLRHVLGGRWYGPDAA